MKIEIYNFDICHGDFLQDHRNVIGVPLAGQTPEQIAQDILDEIGSCDGYDIPEGISDDEIRAAVISDLRPDARFWPADHKGNEIETTDLDDPRLQAEQPYAWFRYSIVGDES